MTSIYAAVYGMNLVQCNMSCQNCDGRILTFKQALGTCVNEGKGSFTVVKGQDYQDAFIINWGSTVQVKNLFDDYGFNVRNHHCYTGIDVKHKGYNCRWLVSVQQRSTFKACYIDVLTNDLSTNRAEKIIISFHTPQLDR
jgi:hypothetical protein